MNNKKLLFKWGDFEDNIKTWFGTIRNTNNFTDVTLAFEGGRTIEAHKIVLVGASHVFTNILQDITYPNPLIYMRGISYDIFNDLIDFIYNGEVNIDEENLNNFLKVGEEFSFRGISNNIDIEQSKPKNTFSQDFKQVGLPNQHEAKSVLQELHIETSGFRVLPDTTDNLDIREINWDDRSDSESKISDPNSFSKSNEALQPQHQNYNINELQIKSEHLNDNKFEINNIYYNESESELKLRKRSCMQKSQGSVCRGCGKSLESNSALAKHKCSDKTVDCDICNKAIRATKLSNHKQRHVLFGDTIKNVKFDNHKGFEDLDDKIEQFISRIEGVWTCQVCNKKTGGSKTCLRGHVEVHHMDLTIPCTQCGATFKSREGLRKHMAVRCPAVLV